MRCRCRDAGSAVAARRSPLSAPGAAVPRAALALAALLALAAPPVRAAASGGDFGFTWATVGDPGNRAALPSERFYNLAMPNLGAVAYEYRVATTEVANAQWLEFMNVYDRYWVAAGNSRLGSYWGGFDISPSNFNPNDPPGYEIRPGAERWPVRIGFRVAARFVNWLHHGKPLTGPGGAGDPVPQHVFESGAYDTSTFGPAPVPGFVTDQTTRSPGARVWIPSLDEWVKAAHYDPDRYGPGQEGYWLRQGGQDGPLTSGRPGEGGQTNAGPIFPGTTTNLLPVGSYPDVRSPWGLLDTSGGQREWTETPTNFDPATGFASTLRRTRGSEVNQGTSFFWDADLIDQLSGITQVDIGTAGLRLASVVPSPATVCVGAMCLVHITRRRRL